MANESSDTSNEFWSKYRPLSSPGKSLFYRYENDGVIVYDSAARIFDEPALQLPLLTEPEKQRKKIDVIDADDYGN